MAMHHLIRKGVPILKNLSSLVGLGINFCPIGKFARPDPANTLKRFRKDLFTKAFYVGRSIEKYEIVIPKMHVESEWEPKKWDLPLSIVERYDKFETSIKMLYRKKCRQENNLLPYQKLALRALALRDDSLIVNCDKNLGPAVIDTSTYAQHALSEHLDTPAYKKLTEIQATAHMQRVASKIRRWLQKQKKSI